MTQGEDQKWTKEKNPNYVVPNKKAAVSNANANGMQTSAQTQENREEDLELFKKEIELLEKIELNTRGMSDSLEKKGKGKDDKTTGMFGQFGDFLKAVPALTKEVLGLGKVIAPFLPQILLAAGALKVGFDAYQLASDEKTVAKSKAIGAGTGTGGDPKKNDVIDTLLTGAGSALGNMNPITAYKRMTGEMTAEQAKQQQIDLGTGLQLILNDGLKMIGIDESQKQYDDDPIMQRNFERLAKEQDRKAELKKKGIVDEKVFDVMPTPDVGSNNEMPKIALPKVAMKEERVGIGDLTKDIKIPSIPKMMFEMPKTGSEQVNPKTAMEKVATLLPTGTKAALDKALVALNPMREIREAIQRMVGFTDLEKRNIEVVMEELTKKGMTPGQIKAILGNIHKENGGIFTREENLNYSKTKNSRIREVFGKERAGEDTPEGNAKLDALKKDKQTFTEHMYGPKHTTGRSLGNNEPGDGWKFRGRGFIQITGKGNYAAASKAIFQDQRLVTNPDLALDPKVAALIAAWYTESRVNVFAKRMGIDLMKASQEQLNKAYTSAIAGHMIDPSKNAYDGELISKVNNAAANPVLSEIITQTGNKLAQGSKMVNNQPPPPAPVIIDNSKTSVSGGGGGGSSPSAGIPNVRNEESSFRRQTDKTSRF
jgi:predicted chitinase